MLNSDSRPAKPAAIVAISAFLRGVESGEADVDARSDVPPKISCSIGEAMPIMPMPAETLRHSTAQISQNCGVLARRRDAHGRA